MNEIPLLIAPESGTSWPIDHAADLRDWIGRDMLLDNMPTTSA
jgi:hypothetical protein